MMAQEELLDLSTGSVTRERGGARILPSQSEVSEAPLLQAPSPLQETSCPTCAGGADSLSYVYALGRVEARFPRLAVEKEFVQATGRADTAGKTDQQAFHAVLSRHENRYLVRQLCWVMTIQGLETYILQPRDPADFELLLETIEPAPQPWVNVVIGVRGPLAPPERCNGLIVPIVVFDQLYTFDRAALIKAIPRQEKSDAGAFESASQELFERIMQITDNAGATDDHRALNYLTMRYPAIYATTVEYYGRNCSLSGIEVRPSSLAGVRKIVEVIFSYTNRNTDYTEKCFARVDVTEEFPFLITKMSPYYDR
jgi:hypothetical protein